jgi:RHS repeat-associated protein
MESETDLVYLRARWYDPTTGRFLQMDSFEGDQEDPQTLHKFAAFNENPMNAVDPSGHDSNGPCGGRISEILQGAFLRNYFNGQRYMPYLIDISVPGIEFIKSWEKLRLALHYDKMGNCTDIGWGHVIHRGKPDGTEPAEFRIDFNLDRAKYWLFIDLTEKMNDVREFVDVPLKQQEFDALVSLVFNTGRGTFAHSAVRMYLNQKEYDKAADAILKVGKQKGGLPTRRLMEKDIFCDGNYVMHK